MKNFENKDYYNLFVTHEETAWENDSNTYIMPHDRSLSTAYTYPYIKDKFNPLNPQTEELIKEYPCLFLYEDGIKEYGFIGHLKKISLRPNGTKISYEIDEDDKISMSEIKSLMFELDISNKGFTELCRTHWAIKNVNLLKEIYPNISSYSNKPKVFISYSWEFENTKQIVKQLVEQLENKNIEVAYDKNSLKLGNDMIYFMESLNDYDKVLVMCDSSYTKKSNTRVGGVGTESEIIITNVYGQPLQNKIIPIILEKDKSNIPVVPTYLKSKYGVDLSDSFNEYEFNKLLKDILEN